VLGAQRFIDDPESQFWGAQWHDGKVFAAGMCTDAVGSWEDCSASQSSMPRTWTTGGGLSSTENLTLVDPPDDAVSDWLSPVIDTGGGGQDALLFWRDAP
jgi:hypothetical protein